MDIEDIARDLACIDAPEKWGSRISNLPIQAKKEVFFLAERLWLERMARSNQLFVHPDILDQLQKQKWVATDLQKRMIWASVLASDESSDRKSRFKTVKQLLTKKYGHAWWEDAYKRIKPAYAAKERIKKQCGSHGEATNMFLNNTMLGSQIAYEDRNQALCMIPRS